MGKVCALLKVDMASESSLPASLHHFMQLHIILYQTTQEGQWLSPCSTFLLITSLQTHSILFSKWANGNWQMNSPYEKESGICSLSFPTYESHSVPLLESVSFFTLSAQTERMCLFIYLASLFLSPSIYFHSTYKISNVKNFCISLPLEMHHCSKTKKKNQHQNPTNSTIEEKF